MKNTVNKFVTLFCFFVLLAPVAWAQNRAPTADIDALVKTYTQAWRETDVVKREKLLEKIWAPNGIYIDSQSTIKGRQKLSEYMGLVMQMNPSNRTVELSTVESRDGVFRFAWRSVMPDGTVHNEGMDFGELDGNGRIRRLVIFFGALTPKSEAK